MYPDSSTSTGSCWPGREPVTEKRLVPPAKPHRMSGISLRGYLPLVNTLRMLHARDREKSDSGSSPVSATGAQAASGASPSSATRRFSRSFFEGSQHGSQLEPDMPYIFDDMPYQNMTAPLSHYFISCGHNSYLTSDQIVGAAGVATIIQVCRIPCARPAVPMWQA